MNKKIRHILATSVFFLLITACLIVSPPSNSQAGSKGAEIIYELAISFDMEAQQLIGTAHLKIPPQSAITLYFNDLQPTGILLQHSSTAPTIFSPEKVNQITIKPENRPQELFISYEKTVLEGYDNFITSEGITLLNNWYPHPSEKVFFQLEANVPQGFIALVESDHLNQEMQNPWRFSFSTAVHNIHFTAAPFVVDEKEVRPGLKVYTYLFPAEQHLADDYLQAAKNFLLRYEEMIGPYPYKHFVIAENIKPTGYGMPTFTLLGRQVIRLPFIKDTSLGHEILHSWFGNGIEVDYAQGNWSEGLASYLADWLYRRDRGEGAANRKEQILKYLSYVNENNAIPLASFSSAHHNQPMARAVRSVGYIKGAMLFHELHNLIGKEHFSQGIQEFYRQFQGSRAGWHDIEGVFSDISGRDLGRFFTERLQRPDIPDLEMKNIEVDNSPGNTVLRFTLRQRTESPYQLRIPIQVESTNWSGRFIREITTAEEVIELSLRSPPSRIVIDPDYDLLRELAEDEMVPTLAHFLGSRKAMLVIDPEDASRYTGLVKFAKDHSWEMKTTEEVSVADISTKDLVLPGKNNSTGLSLFGPLGQPTTGVSLRARHHPLSKGNYVLQVSSVDDEELERVLPKLRHYGKYSFLHFVEGRIATKKITSAQNGFGVDLASEPKALPVRELTPFAEAVTAMSNADVVYLGESHTSMKDHHLQFLVTEKLFQDKGKIAIGMEMFPASSQKVLDEYIFGNTSMDEKQFLKDSRYFQVWKYDYRYYKRVIDFARTHKIPVIGLNIEREVVSSIYQHGSSSKLTEEQKKLLPRERDLSLPGYSERLRAIHELHPHGNSGQPGLSGFIQAQAVWDEVMAANIVTYLRDNPQTTMLVLAGREHARKDSGIPPRVQRRMNVNQYVVMTAGEQKIPSSELADFFFYLEEHQLPPAGRIGITIEEKQDDSGPFLKIASLSSQSNAEKSGLRAGDRVDEINNFTINNMEDIKVALAGTKAGDTVTVKIQRRSSGMASEKNLTVELYSPSGGMTPRN